MIPYDPESIFSVLNIVIHFVGDDDDGLRLRAHRLPGHRRPFHFVESSSTSVYEAWSSEEAAIAFY